MSSKFKVIINWKGEIYNLYTRAPNTNKALHNGINQLAKILNLTMSSVRNYVTDGKNKYTIWELKK